MLRRTIPARVAAAALALLPLAACLSPTASAPAREAAPPAASPTVADLQGATPQGEEAQAIAAIRRGDLEAAHGILSRLLFAGHLADARALLAQGRPEDALLATEEALALFPRELDARLLDGRARLALAELGIQEGRPFTEAMLEDALATNDRIPNSPAADLQAARAAFLLGRYPQALALASSGVAGAKGADIDVDRLPQRTLAEAAYAAFAAAKQADSGEAQALYQRTETALTSLLGRTPADPWVHQTLANLYEWEGKLVEASDALMRGIDRVPTDPAMVQRWVELLRRAEQGPEVLRRLEELVRRHPDLADARYFEAEQRFYTALDSLEAGKFLPQEFRRAEEGFRRCGELNPDYAESCAGYEVICRNAIGWCHYQLGDPQAAEAAFRSMEERFEGGLAWELSGRLLSGIEGLAFCAQSYNEREDWLAAAEVNEYLRHYRPDEVAYANDAGFFFRDAAVAIEYEASRFCYAARGLVQNAETLASMRARAGLDASVPAGSDAEKAALRAYANKRMKQARQLMAKSAAAYRAASALAPEDVRIVNDTALILMYYLHDEIDRAEEMLLRAVALGAAQIDDPALDEDARFALRSAWGDAHQNLGVLHYVYKQDEAAALSWLERSMEIDPEARSDVRDFWLPFLRGEIESADDEDYLALLAWGRPCE